MQISIINRKEIYGALGASSALTYFYGRNVALAAISSFVVAKIISYMQNRKIFSALEKDRDDAQEETRQLTQQLGESNRVKRLTERELDGAKVFLSQIENTDLVEKTRLILEKQEQVQHLQANLDDRNQEIRDLIHELSSLNQRLPSINEELSNARHQISRHQDQERSYRSQLDKKNSQIERLHQQLEPLKSQLINMQLNLSRARSAARRNTGARARVGSR